MAIEKSLYAAPQGIEELDEANLATPDLEIEIENPESVTVGMDGIPILSIEEEEGVADEFDKNLAEDMDESVLQQIGRAHV